MGGCRAMSYLWGMLGRLLKPAFTRAKSYRPTRKHICYVVLAASVLLRLWLIFVTIPGLFVLAVVIWLSLGPDRVTEFVYGPWLRLRARNPQQAEKIRDRFQAGVKRADGPRGCACRIILMMSNSKPNYASPLIRFKDWPQKPGKRGMGDNLQLMGDNLQFRKSAASALEFADLSAYVAHNRLT